MNLQQKKEVNVFLINIQEQTINIYGNVQKVINGKQLSMKSKVLPNIKQHGVPFVQGKQKKQLKICKN